MEEDAPELDLLTITQLRQVAGPSPQPYRLHLQVDGCFEKQTSQGNPFVEIKFADAGDSLVWRVFDNNPCFAEARQLQRGGFLEVAAQWVDAGKYGIEPRQARMRVLNDEERQTLLNGSGETAQRQHADYLDIEGWVEAICDPRLKTLSVSTLHEPPPPPQGED